MVRTAITTLPILSPANWRKSSGGTEGLGVWSCAGCKNAMQCSLHRALQTTQCKRDKVLFFLFMRRPHSTCQKVVQGKCPLHSLPLNGAVCSNTLFANTSFLDHLSVILGKFCMQRFSNTSFGRTLLGYNFGCLLLEQTFCRHFAAFPV